MIDDGGRSRDGRGILRPGDRRIVDVSPSRPSLRRPGYAWSCSNCGDVHPSVGSWQLTFRYRDDPKEHTFIICPACAEELRPRRPKIRVEALEESAADRPRLRVVLDLVAFVTDQRGQQLEQIELRAEDTIVLARRTGVSPDGLMEELRASGVLADT